MTHRLDSSAPEPLYHQLRQDIVRRIETGEFGPGDRIPTEMEICEAYGVSRSTARQALGQLADEGVIIRTRRRGSIVDPSWRRTADDHEIRLTISDSYREDEIRASLPENQRVTIEVVAYDEMREHLLRAIAEGQAPDIAMIDHVWVAEFATGHMIHSLHDLDGEWATRVLADVIHPAVGRGYRFDGDLFAVPEEVNLAGMWFDVVAFDDAGVALPRTWDDIVRAGRALRPDDTNRFPIAMPGGEAGGETTTYCLAALLASNGAAIIDENVVLDSSKAVHALRFVRELVERGLVGQDAAGADWLDAPRKLGRGEVAMTFGGSYEAEHIAKAAGVAVENVHDRFVFRECPAGSMGRRATVIGGMGYAVFKQAHDPYRALDVIKGVTESHRLDARSHRHGTISPTVAGSDRTSRPCSRAAGPDRSSRTTVRSRGRSSAWCNR